MSKQCSRCGENRPVSEFAANAGGKYGVHSVCKPCVRLRNSARYRSDSEVREAQARASRRHYVSSGGAASARERRLRYTLKQHGISREEYDALQERQGGRCAICRKKPDGSRRLAIDHNHSTGRVRGLLCTACNTSLGLLNDSADTVFTMALYLLADKEEYVALAS